VILPVEIPAALAISSRVSIGSIERFDNVDEPLSRPPAAIFARPFSSSSGFSYLFTRVDRNTSVKTR